MVVGVSTGFDKGAGSQRRWLSRRNERQNLVLFVGYSHPVTVEPPKGISFEVDAKTRQIKVLGFEQGRVGQVAADIRKIRPPEPYKGKGIKYLEEKIRRKAGKTGKV
jgi:large subunit ribosomal protein L6